MDKQQPIVRREYAPPPRATTALDMDIRIISATLWPSSAEPTTATVAAADAVEASLLPPTTHLVRTFPVTGLDRDYVRHLERRILRRPRDLTSHVRRILTLNELDDADGIAGALADLYIVLGRAGPALRARLLSAVEPRIESAHAQFFRDHLERGLGATDPMPSFTRSRLSKQVAGTTQIVVISEDADKTAVELAKDAAQQDRAGEAQQLLEGLLETDPGDEEVCETLLDLYEREHCDQDFFRTYTRSLGRPLGRLDRWVKLAATFRQDAGTAPNGDPENAPDTVRRQ